jgi:hypothetical protein
MRVNYKFIKSRLIETFSREEVMPKNTILKYTKEASLKEAIDQDEKTRWKRIGQKTGKSEVGCRNKAKERGWTSR